jgi:DNA-binding winged helix-turn-helix (wHTH) protein
VIYVFADYELDTQRYELRRRGVLCPLEPQGFNVLVYLVQHRDRVVSKEELFAQLWPNQIVSESTLTQRLRAARRVLGDSGQHQYFIKTVHGRGYRFIAAVEEKPGARRVSIRIPLRRSFAMPVVSRCRICARPVAPAIRLGRCFATRVPRRWSARHRSQPLRRHGGQTGPPPRISPHLRSSR